MGFWYVYIKNADGSETRRRKKKILGVKSKMKKWEAEERLRA